MGVIGGFKTRLQLYTVPGQVFYNTTRKLVLKGVDGIVFVADSQTPMLDANRESLGNLHENLAEIGLSLADIPIVLQYNKRDLSNILSVEELNASLNPDASIDCFEASARNGTGVFETLKGISKLTLRALRSKMTGEPRRPSAAMPSGRTGVVPPLAPLAPLAPPAGDSPVFPEAGTSPVALFPPDRATEPGPLSGDDVSDVGFAQQASTPPRSPEDGEVKHVRVRSSVDILSELDKLRKLATQKPASQSQAFPAMNSAAGRAALAKQASLSIDDILTQAGPLRRDVARAFDLSVARSALAHTQRLTITLRFDGGAENGASAVQREVTVDLPSSRDARRLSLSLKFNVLGE